MSAHGQRKRACALLLVAAAAAVDAAPLARLFHSPEERAALDATRSTQKSASAASPATAPAATQTLRPKALSVTLQPGAESKKRRQRRSVMTGFVERSSGNNTVWINNQAQQLRGGYGELDPLEVGKARRN